MYKGTVYSAKGTTWSGSPLWKKAQREVRQHWFIDSYCTLQLIYRYCTRVVEYTPTGLTVSRDVASSPQVPTKRSRDIPQQAKGAGSSGACGSSAGRSGASGLDTGATVAKNLGAGGGGPGDEIAAGGGVAAVDTSGRMQGET